MKFSRMLRRILFLIISAQSQDCANGCNDHGAETTIFISYQITGIVINAPERLNDDQWLVHLDLEDKASVTCESPTCGELISGDEVTFADIAALTAGKNFTDSAGTFTDALQS
ncbi:MAG: hypothetical protein P8J32_00955, partial [bacterium]|nr:hypothetical protein [bacterium]